MLKFWTAAAACALLTSACATGRITLYPSNAELNQLAIKKASDVVKEMPAKHGATVAIIPASGLRSFNEYPQQLIENSLATSVLRLGYTPVERTAEIMKALALNANGFSGGVFPFVSGDGRNTYNADVLAGAAAPKELQLAAPTHEYLKGSATEKKFDPEIVHFLANPGITKTFDFPQPDYFLTYDILSAGIRYSEAENKNGDPQTRRIAQAKFFIKLIDSRNAQILYAEELVAEEVDTVPTRALSMLEKPHFTFFGPPSYGAPSAAAQETHTETYKGVSSLRERIPYEGGKYLTLSAGALSSGDTHFLIVPRFDDDFGEHLGFRAGLQLSNFDVVAVGAGFKTTTSVTLVAPELAVKWVLPVNEHFLPYVLAGPALKVVLASNGTLAPALTVGAGSLFPLGKRLVIRLDVALHASGDVQATVEDPNNSSNKTKVVLINGLDEEASLGVGVKF